MDPIPEEVQHGEATKEEVAQEVADREAPMDPVIMKILESAHATWSEFEELRDTIQRGIGLRRQWIAWAEGRITEMNAMIQDAIQYGTYCPWSHDTVKEFEMYRDLWATQCDRTEQIIQSKIKLWDNITQMYVMQANYKKMIIEGMSPEHGEVLKYNEKLKDYLLDAYLEKDEDVSKVVQKFLGPMKKLVQLMNSPSQQMMLGDPEKAESAGSVESVEEEKALV